MDDRPRSEPESLVDRARAGEETAWEEIVAEFGPRIRGYARGKGAPDPDDVVQDVFVAAASRIGDFVGDLGAFRSWLFSIAYRQIANRHRVADRRPVELSERPDGSPGPEDLTVEGAAHAEALAALDILDPIERDVVLLRVIGGLDSAEVGRAVGKRPGTVRVIQSRALKRVRAELIRLGYGGPRG